MNSCTICMKEELDNNNTYTTDCNHMFCKECLDGVYSSSPRPRDYWTSYARK